MRVYELLVFLWRLFVIDSAQLFIELCAKSREVEEQSLGSSVSLREVLANSFSQHRHTRACGMQRSPLPREHANYYSLGLDYPQLSIKVTARIVCHGRFHPSHFASG